MLYTRKGDNGKTSTLNSNGRISKSSPIIEALGALDELNSFLGICKAKADVETIKMLENIQNSLFIIQAEIAGASGKKINRAKTEELEITIAGIEKQLPEIKSFIVSGGTELSVCLDFARTLARKAERRVISVVDGGTVKVELDTVAYLNRLSSLLYALSRFANLKSGTKEKSPKY